MEDQSAGSSQTIDRRLLDYDFWKQEYVLVCQTFQKYHELYLKLFSVYLGITALTIRYVLDGTVAHQVKLIMFGIGSVFSLLWAIGVYLVRKVARMLKYRKSTALENLGVTVPDDFVGGDWFINAMSAICVLVILCWITIALATPEMFRLDQ